ncbi:MAG: hypothetical protein P4L51_04680 [Puia sp.]|nr:hypothetical protein [Puia sp.]
MAGIQLINTHHLHTRLLAIIIPICLLAASCSDGKVTSSWKAAQAGQLPKDHKVLILGIIQDQDVRLRMQMEGFMVDALKEKGYNAVSAYTLYGPKQFGKMDEQAMLDRLRNSGIDQVMTITLLDRSRERHYTPPAGYNPYSPFWDYYSYRYAMLYGPSPGYITTNTRFFWETNLYTVNGKNLVFSIQSETFNPSSTSSLGKSYSRLILKNMTKAGLLAEK